MTEVVPPCGPRLPCCGDENGVIPSTGGVDDGLRFKLLGVIFLGEIAEEEREGCGGCGGCGSGVGGRKGERELVVLVAADPPRAVVDVDKDGVTARVGGDAASEFDYLRKMRKWSRLGGTERTVGDGAENVGGSEVRSVGGELELLLAPEMGEISSAGKT